MSVEKWKWERLGIWSSLRKITELSIYNREFSLLNIVNTHYMCQALSASIPSPLDFSPVKSAAILQAVTWFGRRWKEKSVFSRSCEEGIERNTFSIPVWCTLYTSGHSSGKYGVNFQHLNAKMWLIWDDNRCPNRSGSPAMASSPISFWLNEIWADSWREEWKDRGGGEREREREWEK